MTQIETYILQKIARAFLLSFAALTMTVWLTQALRQFDLVSAMGQTLITFFKITLLLLPSLTMVTAPMALLLAVVFTFNSLNQGSELVVINAAGAKQWWLLKPVLVAALGVAIFMATMSLYLSPLSLRMWRELRSEVNGNLLTSILREGEFIEIEDRLFFQLRERRPDGTLRGIFLSDSREDGENVDYIAERGAVLDNPLGMFLVMSDGTIQTRKDEEGKKEEGEKDTSLSIIQFTSYAFDLSTFSSPSKAPAYMPNERPTTYLFSPDPDDRYYQKHPGKFVSELHTRFTTPINAFVFAIIPLLFLSQAETVRQKRSATIALAATSAFFLAGLQFVLSIAARDQVLTPLAMYFVPIIAVIASAALILFGIQPRAPDGLIAWIEKVADGFRGIFRRKPATATPSS
ncbi:MAG TPA: LptF/LptG family permease [Bauldia sp.]|nr:LptF/LptG family permease [Bauldia sp.]